MRNKLISGFAGAAFSFAASGLALAADMAVKAPPPAPAPVSTWTGPYMGVNAGGTWGSGSVDSVGTPTFALPMAQTSAAGLAALGTYSLDPKNDAFIGGVQVGLNLQFNSWVISGEADIQGVTGHGRANQAFSLNLFPNKPPPPEFFNGTQSAERRIDLFGTLRARLGYLVTPTLLAYATGGLAYADVHAGGSVSAQDTLVGCSGGLCFAPVSGGDIASSVRAGWTAGGGLEWMFAPHWSVKAEYLYYDLGTVDGSYTLNEFVAGGPLNATATVHTSARINGNIARAGLNWHF
jgi:outer membrane immunogenic protein